ncbi:methyltransferase family protein [Stenotrophomonas bentonitica]
MQWLETRIPPPLVLLTLGVAGFGMARSTPGLSFQSSCASLVAVLLALAGLALNLLPKVAFRRAGTSANPLRPAATRHLVTSGIYRYTRNPMYLGHALILSGWIVHLGNVLALIVIPLFVLFITRFQIRPEERALATTFQDYEQFCRRSPRWLWHAARDGEE